MGDINTGLNSELQEQVPETSFNTGLSRRQFFTVAGVVGAGAFAITKVAETFINLTRNVQEDAMVEDLQNKGREIYSDSLSSQGMHINDEGNLDIDPKIDGLINNPNKSEGEKLEDLYRYGVELYGEDAAVKVEDFIGSMVAFNGIKHMFTKGHITMADYGRIVACNIFSYATAKIRGDEHRAEHLVENAKETGVAWAMIEGITFASRLIDVVGIKALADKVPEIAEMSNSINEIAGSSITKGEKLKQLIAFQHLIGSTGSTILSSALLKPLCESIAFERDEEVFDPKTGIREKKPVYNKAIMSALQGYIPNNSGSTGLLADIGPRIGLLQKAGMEGVVKASIASIPHHILITAQFYKEVNGLLDEDQRVGKDDASLAILIGNVVRQGIKFNGAKPIIEILSNIGSFAKSFANSAGHDHILQNEVEAAKFLNALDLEKVIEAYSSQSTSGESSPEDSFLQSLTNILEPLMANGLTAEQTLELKAKLGSIMIEAYSTIKEYEAEHVAVGSTDFATKSKIVWNKLTDIHAYAEIFGTDMVEITNALLFQSGAVPFIEGFFSNISKITEAQLIERTPEGGFLRNHIDTVMDIINTEATAVMSSSFDNLAAFKAFYTVMVDRIKTKIGLKDPKYYSEGVFNKFQAGKDHFFALMKSYQASIIGGGFLPSGNMPNFVLFSQAFYSMADALGLNFAKRHIPLLISYLTTMGLESLTNSHFFTLPLEEEITNGDSHSEGTQSHETKSNTPNGLASLGRRATAWLRRTAIQEA